MRMLAYLLAIICLIAAATYFLVPAGSLPGFMPGFEAGSAHMHMKRAGFAVIAAIVLFGIGWLSGRRR